MSTALAILAHALRMLVFEPSATLRVIFPAVLLVLVSSGAIATLAPDAVALMQSTTDTPVLPSPSSVALMLVFGILALIGYALMAILWHRYVLLNGAERTEDLRPSGRIFARYVWRAIVVGCVQLLAAIPVILIMGALGAAFIMDNPNEVPALIIGLLGSLVFIWVALRVSVVLPAAAMGQVMPVADSWATTKSVSTELWGVATLLTGLNIFVYFITGLILPEAGFVAAMVQTLVFIIEGLVFISVLTTLYGHLVEGRSLGQ